MYNFLQLFLLYFFYCVFGYFLECTYCTIKDDKLVLNRGFLVGPYLPIYGNGAMIILLLLSKYRRDLVILFIMACLISTVLEYLTSYIMEKVFKARWWDYSKRKYNINGRVCLSNTVLFGLGGILIMYIVNPMFTKIIGFLDYKVVFVLGFIFLILYFSDIVISISTIYKLRSNSLNLNKDSTEEISEQVHKKLMKHKHLKKRLLNAFPDTNDIKSYNKIKQVVNTKKKKG